MKRLRRPDPEDLRYARLWRDQSSMATIAEALGVDELALIQALDEPWAPTRRHTWTPAEDAILIRDYPAGDTRLIARRLGRSTQSIKNRTHSLGLRKTSAWWLRWRRLTHESQKSRKSSVPPNRNAVSLPDRYTNTEDRT